MFATPGRLSRGSLAFNRAVIKMVLCSYFSTPISRADRAMAKFVNLDLKHNNTGFTAASITSSTSSTFLNCILESNVQNNMISSWAGTCIRCIIKRTISGIYYPMITLGVMGKFLHCYFYGSRYDYDYVQVSATGGVLYGNFFTNCYHGVYCVYPYKVTIMNNSFINNASDGIYFSNSGFMASDIHNNVFAFNGGAGIRSIATGTNRMSNMHGNIGYNNTAGFISSNISYDDITNVDLAESPFVGAFDYTLKDRLGGSVPDMLPIPNWYCYGDPGALKPRRSSISRARLVGGI